MKPIIKTMGVTYAVIASLWLLGGCQSLAYDAVKLVYGDEPFVQDAKNALGHAMRFYDHTAQPSIEVYINWPTCGSPAAKGKILCKNLAVARKLQAADDPTSGAIDKAVAVLNGVGADDTGTALTDAVKAVNDQNAELIKAGVPQ